VEEIEVEEKPIEKKVVIPIDTGKVEIESESDSVKLDTSHMISDPAPEAGGCSNKGLLSSLGANKPIVSDGTDPASSLEGANAPTKGCGGLGNGCGNMGSGCSMIPSWAAGCQKIGCGLLSLLLCVALLLWLLRECNHDSSDSSSSGSEDQQVRIDTVRVYEVDTVVTVKMDTLFTVDTVRTTDTMYTVIKNVIPLPNVIFKTNSAVIRNSSLKGLKKLGDSLKVHEELNMIIAGHTDASGGMAHNDTLSFCRAKAVRDVLVDSCSIDPSRLIYEGYGENCPREDNTSAEGMTTNRRVEFRYFNEELQCKEFKIKINDNFCNAGAYKSAVEPAYAVSDQEVDEGIIEENNKKDETSVKRANYKIGVIDDPYFISVRKRKTNLSEIIFTINKDQRFEILEKHGSWVEISLDGKKGYVHESQIKIIEK
jgi:outer membrane protein OmpA-like peptidoglycan-associated protein